MNNKNILFIINGMGGGGAQRNIAKLSDFFCKIGNNVFILCLTDTLNFYELNKGVKIIHKIGKHKNKYINLLYWRKSIRDVIDVHEIGVIIAVGIRYGLLAALSKKRKVKLIIRGASTIKFNFLSKIIMFFMNSRIDNIVAQTIAQKNNYPKFLFKKINIIPNPFDVPTENPNIDGFNKKRIVTIGRLFLPVKHTDDLIMAFNLFSKTHEDFYFDIYGEPQLDDKYTVDKLNFLIQSLNLQDKVTLRGMDTDLINNIQNNTFCFIFGSSIEGMPNALIEAKMLGIPCISTNWNGCSEIIQNKTDGFITKIGDIQSIASIISDLVKDESLYFKISNIGHQNCMKYSAKNIFDIWKKLIN